MSATRHPQAPVLIVDDEEQALVAADLTLRSEGITNIVTCRDSRLVAGKLAEGEWSAVLLDLSMPHRTGLELLPRIVQEHPEVPVIVVTANAELDTAVQCMREGAFDYLLKPVEDARLVSAVRHALEMRQARGENERLARALQADGLEHPEAFAAIVTDSPSMHGVFRYVEAIAATPLPVLVTGETGVGKELIARAIHGLSGRTGAFVPVNVAGLDDTLFSDALFGHKRGGFTGADRDRPGLIEQAAGGTLFLDEIGDLAAASQVKLLRLLQEGRYYPIGSDLQKASDARVVVATNRDLAAMQEKGEFRRDLYYRLRSHHVHLPPLRRREGGPAAARGPLPRQGRGAARPEPAHAAEGARRAAGGLRVPGQRPGAGRHDLRRGQPSPLGRALAGIVPGEDRARGRRGLRRRGRPGGGRRGASR